MPDDPESPEVPDDEQTMLQDESPGAGGATPLTPVTPGRSGGATFSTSGQVLGTIGDFEVVDKLGQGGMGAVYRARQISLDRLVALKILPHQFEEDEDYVARFQREARVAAGLNHPNLVRVFASGQADGSHFEYPDWGGHDPLVSGREGLNTMHMLEGGDRSAKLNQAVELPLT